MDYKSFIKEVSDLCAQIFGEEYDISLKTVRKNNNVVLDGLTIHKEGESISPTIYLNHYYQNYLSGDSVINIANEIMRLYATNRVHTGIDTDFFTQYEMIKERVVFKIIHYEKNKVLLESIPHIKFLDLAIVFYYLVQNDILGNATILIYNSHLEIWEKEIYDIYQIAKENTQRILKHNIRHIEDILKEELAELEELEEEFARETMEGEVPMYVLTNHIKLNGAVCMLYPEILKEFSNTLNCNLILLPSSVHEMIIIPKSSNTSLEDLKEMVRDTNENHVEEEEILSYSVYEYVREEDRILISL